METITGLDPDTVEALEELIHANTDTSKSFEAAAAAIDDTTLAPCFREIALRRSRNAAALRCYVAPLDDGFDEIVNRKRTLYRWWSEIRATLQEENTHAVLAEAERSEALIKNEYERILKEIAHNPLNDELRAQYREIRQQYSRVRDLRERLAAAG